MEYIETGRIISTDICRQFIGTDDSLTAFKLKLAAFISILAKGRHHFTQSVVSSVFMIYLPVGCQFNYGLVLIQPGFHARQPMRKRMQHICYEKHRQLTVGQSVPVRMRDKDRVNDFLGPHFHKTGDNQWDSVYSFYSVFHHKPPYFKVYDDYCMKTYCLSSEINLISNRCNN